jgi:thiamine pyrophosphokinase
MNYETIIFANGDIPTHFIPLDLLKNAKNIVCCDGAIEKLQQLGYHPTAIVGDMDSISPVVKHQFAHLLFQDSSEEYNDLQKAIRFCIHQKWNHIAILGGFGLREDHALANLSIMMQYVLEYNSSINNELNIEMFTNNGVFSAFSDTKTFSSYPKQQISIFSFKQNTLLTFEGLKYPVQNRSFHYLWEGSLNEALTDQFTIQCGGGEVIVFRNY